MTVLTATSDAPQVLASNQLNAAFIASPAVAGDSLILRSTTHLYCIADGHHRTEEQVAADVYPKQRETKPKTAKATTNEDQDRDLAALGAQLKEMVKAGKLTPKDAIELYQAAAGK